MNKYSLSDIDEIRDYNRDRFTEFFPASLQSEELLDYLYNNAYFTAPSACGIHGAWIGGNYDHSMKVTEYLLQYTKDENLTWEREESPYIIGMFHDLCKSDIRDFKMTKDGKLKVITVPNKDKRHAEKSLELIAPFIELTIEEKLCIYYHMGKYDETLDYIELMDKVALKYPNILWTQKADTRAAREGI
ncbi:MAG: HD domain-containing protein [Saccharofermentans sp.]|nr:HD domain-containing protein [Saccharofermentans sp.]